MQADTRRRSLNTDGARRSSCYNAAGPVSCRGGISDKPQTEEIHRTAQNRMETLVQQTQGGERILSSILIHKIVQNHENFSRLDCLATEIRFQDLPTS
jgi:hypothetical protein